MAWRDVIMSLNSLGVGDLGSIRRKLDEAREEVRAQGQADLAERLEEAALALDQGQLAEYRRLLSQVVSRLGHLRD